MSTNMNIQEMKEGLEGIFRHVMTDAEMNIRVEMYLSKPERRRAVSMTFESNS